MLHQALGEQDSWLKPKLLSWKLKSNRQTMAKSARILQENLERRRGEGVLPRTVIFLMAVAVVVHSYSEAIVRALTPVNSSRHAQAAAVISSFKQATGASELVAAAVVFVVMSILGQPASSSSSSSTTPWRPKTVACLFSWLVSMCVNLGLQAGVFPSEMEEFLPYLSVFCVATSFVNLFASSSSKKNGKTATTKALLPYRPKVMMLGDGDAVEEDTRTQELLSSTNTSSSLDKRPPVSICGLQEREEIHIRPGSSLTASPLPLPPPPSNRSSFVKRNNCDISTLSIADEDESGDSSCADGERRPDSCSPTFSIRNYSTAGSSWKDFERNSRRATTKTSILRPPTFEPKRVAKASWVAGGYWDHHNPSKKFGDGGGRGENVSRSSSQSSGFVSYSGRGRMNPNLFAASSLPSEPRNTIFASSRPNSQMGRGHSESSFDTSLERLTQEAFSELRPQANSSPIEAAAESQPRRIKLLEKQISIRFSLYSLLLGASVALNVTIAAYIAYHFI